MQQFEVCFHYQEDGITIVDANTAHEAEKKVYKHLEEEGLNDLCFKPINREYGISCVRTVKHTLFDGKVS